MNRKTINRIIGLIVHLCVISSLICLTAKILDWYNPYMNFTGYVSIFQNILYAAVILLGVVRYRFVTKK